MPFNSAHQAGAILIGVLGLSAVFPSSVRLLTALLYLPLWFSLFVVLLVATVVYRLVRSDHFEHHPTLVERQRQALRPLSFTTPSAWSAVLTRHAWESGPPQLPALYKSSPPELDRAVNTFLEAIKTLFILPWYDRISPSHAFPNSVDVLVRSVLVDIVRRAETVDWSLLLSSRLVPLLKDHLHHYASVEHLAPALNVPFSPASLSLPLPKEPHPALSSVAHLPGGLTPPSVEMHLREWVVRILGDSLPKADQSEVVQILGREVVLCTVLMPVFDMLSDGDFWNQQVDDKGGKYIHEQKQVTRFLSALSAMPSSATPSPRRARKNTVVQNRRLPPAAGLITANSSSKDFDAFLRSISKVRTLGEARRLRSDIERELRRAQTQLERHKAAGLQPKEGELVERKLEKFVKRLERADATAEAWIAMLGNGQGRSATKHTSTPLAASTGMHHSTTMDRSTSVEIDLYAVLSDPASLAYWLEHMERRKRSRLVQYWLTVEGFKDPLEAVGRDSALDNALLSNRETSLDSIATLLDDVKFLIMTYFDSDSPVPIPTRSLNLVRDFVHVPEDSRSIEQVRRVRYAIYVSQKAVYEQMEEEDWPTFKDSELYRKARADLAKNVPVRPTLNIPTINGHLTESPTLPPLKRAPPHLGVSPSASPVLPSSPELGRSTLPRPSPLLMHNSGFFTPGTATPSAGVTMTPPNFDRRVTEPSKQDKVRETRKVSEGDVDKMSMSVPSLPVTPAPQMPRRSSQLDFLTSAGELQASAEDRGKLFEDGNDTLHEEEEEDFEEIERIKAIQAALSEIISDEKPPLHTRRSDRSASETPEQDLDSAVSPSASMMLLRSVEESRKMRDNVKQRTRSAEDLQKIGVKKSSISAPQTRLPSLGESNGKLPNLSHRSSLTTLSERPHADLFGDEMVDAVGDDLADGDKTQDNIIMPTPGNLQLSVEIARLQDKITELVKQESLLTTLIRQAELTGSQSELRILNRSLSSVSREQRTAIFQKAQFEQQEETNRLVPGRTKVIIPASVITTEDTDGGKNIVRYTIQVQQVSEKGEVEAAWMVARRYNEFFELDKALRDLSATDVGGALSSDIRGAAELPGKKLVIAGGSASFVEGRRLGLERYLQSLLASGAICNAAPLRHFLSYSPVELSVPPAPQRANSDPLLTGQPMSPSLSQTASANLNVSAQSLVKTLYKTMATSLDDALLGPNMVDMMYATLTRQINDMAGGVGGVLSIGEELAGYGSSFLPSGLRQLGRTESTPASVAAAKQLSNPVQPMGGETGLGSFTTPICDLFIELFDLKENNWLRRQAIVVILQQLLGSTVERRVRDTIRAVLSPTSFVRIIGGLTDSLFPDGQRRPSSAPRTPEEMLETKLSASRKLAHLIPDMAAQMIGRGNARRAARRVFGMLQDRRLNQQLLLCILDEVLKALYPGPPLQGTKA